MKTFSILFLALAFCFLFEAITNIKVIHGFTNVTISKVIQSLGLYGAAYFAAWGIVSVYIPITAKYRSN